MRLPHLDRADVAALFVATRRAGFGWLCLALRILLDRHDARWRDAPATRVRDLEPALDLAALVAEALDLLAARGWYSRDGGRYVPAGGPR